MKVGKTGLKMSSGEIRHFRSKGARERFERVAQAIKHGWEPSGKRSRSGSPPFTDAEMTQGYRSLGPALKK